jgi:CHASE2 domain-containing sensor protein
MVRTAWRLRLALFLAVGLGVTGLWLVAYGTNVFKELDLDTVDWRFSIRGEEDPTAEFAVVGIDDVTFDELDEYPLKRRRLSSRLRTAGG